MNNIKNKTKLTKNNNKNNNIKNSELIKTTLITLINITSLKTTKDYAWSVVKNLINELIENHDFLKFIKIDDLKSIDYSIDDIRIESGFDDIEPIKIGAAIQSLVDLLKKRLGKKAGYFFIREFKYILGEEYYSHLKYIGVDLRLIDLENELFGMDSNKFKIKDKINSNIAYLEKNE